MSDRSDAPLPAAPASWATIWSIGMRDHGALRTVWHNFERIDADLWRHNQPSRHRLAWLKAQGAASVLSLRGARAPTAGLERDACAALGLTHRAIRLRALKPPLKAALLEVLDALESLPKPLVIHCKSGADRTGLVTAIYLHTKMGLPLAEARQKALNWRYAQNPFGRARKVADMFFDHYAEVHARDGIRFEDWAREVYHHRTVMRAVNQRYGKR